MERTRCSHCAQDRMAAQVFACCRTCGHVEAPSQLVSDQLNCTDQPPYGNGLAPAATATATATTAGNTTATGPNGATFPQGLLLYQRHTKLSIFLSYGHDRYKQLALRLKAALQERGHSVWVDVDELSAGIDWEGSIDSGLTSIKEAQQDGRVLLIMTPHALRRPDGFCLNEIARATANRLSIFPVLVADSEPPPSITMLPFFDMRDCVPNDPELLQLDPAGDEWHRLMTEKLQSKLFHDKCVRLFAVLELFDSIGSYGVPSVAGMENLGLFASSTEPARREFSHSSSSLRRLLAHRLSLQSDGGTPPTSEAGGIGPGAGLPPLPREMISKRDSFGVMGEVAAPELQRRHGSDASSSSLTSSINENAVDDSEAMANTRFVLSFDPSCLVLARQLYEDLTALGFQLYPVDPPRLDDEESSREEAMKWAVEEQNGKMILLVTPESVGRPHGTCLNDISAAMVYGMGFVPLMVRHCEIPLSICRIQWLDMSDCFNYNPEEYHRGSVVNAQQPSQGPTFRLNRVRYELRRDQLITALKGKLDHEGQQARLFSLLAPFSFQSKISKLTKLFAGRQWLFDRVQKWIESNASGQPVFWITGQIGSGKTALAAKMIETFPEICAFHFSFQEDEQTQSARRCVLSLAYQLTTQLPEYAQFLQSAANPLEEVIPMSSFQSLVTYLLVEPLNAIARPKSDKPIVLLLDGLEHLLSYSRPSLPPSPTMVDSSKLLRPRMGSSDSLGNDVDECLISTLPSLISRLPSWVRIILLSREDNRIRNKLQSYVPSVCLDNFREENQQDIKLFVTSALMDGVGDPQVDSQLSTNSSASSTGSMPRLGRQGSFIRRATPSACAHLQIPSGKLDFIAKKAEGLFLYAVNIVQALQEKRLLLENLESFPVGMGGFLSEYFHNHFEEVYYKTKIRPVLEILCAAYEPLTLSMLSSILKWNGYEQQDIINSFGSLLHITESEVIQPFHTCVFDWVQDGKTAGNFFVEALRGHESIGIWACEEYETSTRSRKNDFINLNFELETSKEAKQKAHIYIVRHAFNHLMQSDSAECVRLVGKLASEENFQLARRLLRLREKGLESFFHGDITRERSQQLLMTFPKPGSFLIRYSAKQKCYCTSFIDRINPATGAPKFRHNLIYHLESGAYSVYPPEQVTKDTTVYPDLVSFVEEFQRKGILQTAIGRQAPLNRAISLSHEEN